VTTLLLAFLLFCAGGCGGALLVRWLGQPVDDAPAVPYRHLPPGADCDHLWSDWSAPEPIEPYAAMPSWGGSAYVTQRQDRNCFKCKMIQRALI
jgi:hypothetical protein